MTIELELVLFAVGVSVVLMTICNLLWPSSKQKPDHVPETTEDVSEQCVIPVGVTTSLAEVRRLKQ
jgi:hypothetical protein